MRKHTLSWESGRRATKWHGWSWLGSQSRALPSCSLCRTRRSCRGSPAPPRRADTGRGHSPSHCASWSPAAPPAACGTGHGVRWCGLLLQPDGCLPGSPGAPTPFPHLRRFPCTLLPLANSESFIHLPTVNWVPIVCQTLGIL